MSHHCHANGCKAVDCHPELPFCKRHFNMLPEPYKKLLWKGRRKDGVCGACDPREADEVPLRADKRWSKIFNLSCAMILLLEYEDCGGHPQCIDDGGFCWGCGVFDAEQTYDLARKEIKKFGIHRPASVFM